MQQNKGKTTLVYETAKYLAIPIEKLDGSADISPKDNNTIGKIKQNGILQVFLKFPSIKSGFYDSLEYWIGSNDEKNRDDVQLGRLLGILKSVLKLSFKKLVKS